SDLFRTLEGDFQMAFTLPVKYVWIVHGMKYMAGEILVERDVAVDFGRSGVSLGLSAALGMEMTFAVGVEFQGPLRRIEAGVGKLDLDDGIVVGACSRDEGDCKSDDTESLHRRAS